MTGFRPNGAALSTAEVFPFMLSLSKHAQDHLVSGLDFFKQALVG